MSSSRPEVTRRCAASRSAVECLSTDCTCRHSAPWYADFRAELLSFPAGRHDDQVDALGLVGQLLDVMISGRTPPKEEKKKPKIGYSAHELEQESFKVY